MKRKLKKPSLSERVIALIESARQKVAYTANLAQVYINYEIGRQIVEEEQGGKRRAGYGERILIELSAKLTARFGKGWGDRSLRRMRQLYVEYSTDEIRKELIAESAKLDLDRGSVQIAGCEVMSGAKVEKAGGGGDATGRGLRPRRMRDSGVAWIGAIPEGWRVADETGTTETTGTTATAAGSQLAESRVSSQTPCRGSRGGLGGPVPEDWQLSRVKFIARIENASDSQTEGPIPVYGSGGTSFRTCGEFKEGPTVLLGRKGSLNIPHFIEGRYWKVDTAFDVKMKGDNDLRWFYYMACCFDYEFYMSQTTLPSMTQTNYNNMPIPLPPLSEQRAIADYLDEKCAAIDVLVAQAPHDALL